MATSHHQPVKHVTLRATHGMKKRLPGLSLSMTTSMHGAKATWPQRVFEFNGSGDLIKEMWGGKVIISLDVNKTWININNINYGRY